MEELYCGVYLTHKNGYTSYAANKINNLISYISSERNVRKALDNKTEIFSLFYIPDGSFIVYHLHEGRTSFSKITDGQLSDVLYNDIDYLLSNTVLNDFSRMVNKSAYYVLNQTQKNSDILSERLLKKIQDKDFSEENKTLIKDYDLTNYKNGKPLHDIKTNRALSLKVQNLTSKGFLSKNTDEIEGHER